MVHFGRPVPKKLPPLWNEFRHEAKIASLLLTTKEHTERFGRVLSAAMFPPIRGDVIAFRGDVGVGKTSMTRGFIRHQTGKDYEKVLSPSYLLEQAYELEHLPRFKWQFESYAKREDAARRIKHVDFYRLSDAMTGADCEALDLIQGVQRDMCVMEWPDRLFRAFDDAARCERDAVLGELRRLWPSQWLTVELELAGLRPEGHLPNRYGPSVHIPPPDVDENGVEQEMRRVNLYVSQRPDWRPGRAAAAPLYGDVWPWQRLRRLSFLNHVPESIEFRKDIYDK